MRRAIREGRVLPFVLCSEFLEACIFDKLGQGFRGEDFPTSRQDHFLHVLTSHSEPTAAYAGDDLEFRLVSGKT